MQPLLQSSGHGPMPPWPPVPKVVPPALPVGGRAGWMGRDMQHSETWKYRLTDADIAELDAALAHVAERGMGLLQMRTMDEFPLQRFAATLAGLREQLLHGRGFLLIKGLPLSRYSKVESAIIYWGIGLHFGYPVPQNGKGHMLGHVTDLGKRSDPNQTLPNGARRPFISTEIRGYNSRERFFFHVDNADVVGLLCLHAARQGGQSLIASSVAIHDEIQRQRPDLLAALYQPFYTSRQNELPAGARPYFRMPVFQIHQGRFAASYWRAFVENCSKFPELPPLTPLQLEAFDLIDALADRPDFHVSMDLEQGDMQFINNQDILHTRTAYEDFDEPERKRHLLRLWLVAPDARPLSQWFYDYYGQGRRGGICVPGVAEVASFEP